MGKSSINGPFSMAMLNNQRVRIVTDGVLRGGTMVIPMADTASTPSSAREIYKTSVCG